MQKREIIIILILITVSLLRFIFSNNDETLFSEAINQKVFLKISDNGLGIPNELIDKIFIPFFSTEKTGNGIGLSLCKQVMMLHRGQITVQSIENQGSIFTLTFDSI